MIRFSRKLIEWFCVKKIIILGIKSLLGVLKIIEGSFNSGNLPYLVFNTYGLYFIQNKGICFFSRGPPPPFWAPSSKPKLNQI